jgi:predicted acetyltransferase
MFTRTTDWWDSRVLMDAEWRRGGGGEMARILLEIDGEPAGYALYRLHPSFDHGHSTGHTKVIEALGTTPESVAELWRFLLDIDWMDRVEAQLLPIDHPLLFLLAEPRRLRFRIGDGLWVRLVDVGAALAGRTYNDGPPLVLEVEDDFCPWNAGSWRLENGAVEHTGDPAGLRLDVTSLASVYLGGFTFGQLARAGRVEELKPGAITAADALFATDVEPWCPEIF